MRRFGRIRVFGSPAQVIAPKQDGLSNVETTFEELRRAINALRTDICERPRGAGTSIAFERNRNFACITKYKGWVRLDLLRADLAFEDGLQVGPGEMTLTAALSRIKESYEYGVASRR